jgi:hypothetical protein
VGPELRTGPARSVTHKEAEVRIYVDADIMGLGLILAALRNDVTYPGDPGAEFTNGSARRVRSRMLRFSTSTGSP